MTIIAGKRDWKLKCRTTFLEASGNLRNFPKFTKYVILTLSGLKQLGIDLEDTCDAKHNHRYPKLTSENRCCIRFMRIFAIVRGQKWQEKDIRNSYLSPDINFWCFLSIFGCFSVIPVSFTSSVVLSVNLYKFVNITQGWSLARAEFSRTNHRKSAVSSLQILQSPLDLTQGRIQSSSNYCFPPLDQSDHRAQISARIIHDN